MAKYLKLWVDVTKPNNQTIEKVYTFGGLDTFRNYDEESIIRLLKYDNPECRVEITAYKTGNGLFMNWIGKITPVQDSKSPK